MLLERSSTQPSVFERTHHFVRTPVRLQDGTTIAAEDLAARFYESEIGGAMVDQPLRYVGRFGYDRDSMLHDIGHDLCPVGHQLELPYHTARVIEAEIRNNTEYGNLSEDELGILMFTCLIHDIGESVHEAVIAAGLQPVGDIPAGMKTDIDRANEAQVRRFFYDTFFSDVDEAVIERVEAIISHVDTSLLHTLFEAGHEAQTLETSMFAYHALTREQWHQQGDIIDPTTVDGQRLSGLLGIARVAHAHHRPAVEELSYLSHIRELTQEADQRLHYQFEAA